jgi:RNA polymerase sigma-70 factor, ECF subfamily
MTGSVIDGEDVVQDTLLKAFAAGPSLVEIRHVKAWVFRLAHNQAIDRWRSYEQRTRASLEAMGDPPDESALGSPADEALAREQALRAALSRFLELAPLQRSCVILKDVLDHSLEEIAELLATTVPAVQAALHRGRQRIAELRRDPPEPPAPTPPVSLTLTRYAALFNAHDWDALRALLADDVRLDLVARFKRQGRNDVGRYFANYERMPTWRVEPSWLEGRELLAVLRAGDDRPAYFIQIDVDGGQVIAIRDYHHVPYVANEAHITLATR